MTSLRSAKQKKWTTELQKHLCNEVSRQQGGNIYIHMYTDIHTYTHFLSLYKLVLFRGGLFSHFIIQITVDTVTEQKIEIWVLRSVSMAARDEKMSHWSSFLVPYIVIKWPNHQISPSLTLQQRNTLSFSLLNFIFPKWCKSLVLLCKISRDVIYIQIQTWLNYMHALKQTQNTTQIGYQMPGKDGNLRNRSQNWVFFLRAERITVSKSDIPHQKLNKSFT